MPSANLIANLRELSRKISAHSEIRKFSEIWDWQSPSLDKDDLANMVELIADKVDAIDWSSTNEDTKKVLEDLANKVLISLQKNVPNLFGGPMGADALIAFLYGLELQLGGLVSLQQLKGTLALPTSLKKPRRCHE
jgi:hypothetical protein